MLPHTHKVTQYHDFTDSSAANLINILGSSYQSSSNAFMVDVTDAVNDE